METAMAYKKARINKGISQYNQNSIFNASPSELILRLYDLAIISINKKDIKKANQVLTELIAGLNFEFKEESLGLFGLYRYCQDCLYKGDFKEPLEIIEELRKTWAQAFNLL